MRQDNPITQDARIAEILKHEMADDISGKIQLYIEEKHRYKSPILIIGKDKDLLEVSIIESTKKHRLTDSMEFALSDLIIKDEFKAEHPNFEAINKVVNDFISLSFAPEPRS